MNVQEAHDELRAIDNLPYGIARCDRAEALIRRIEAEGPEESLATAYLDLIEAYSFSAEAGKSFQALARTLRLFDERPELWDEYDRHGLFWRFKWVAGDLPSWPNISRQQAEAILDDMERRYDLEGAGRSAVEAARFNYACSVGDPKADEYRQRWLGTPRDDFSDCEACEPGEQAAFYWQYGRLEELVAMEPRLHGSCNREPSHGLSALALGQLGLGQAEDANRSLRKSIRTLTLDFPTEVAPLRGRHLLAFLLGDRIEEAMHMLRTRDAPLLPDGGESPLAQLQFMISLLSGLSAQRDQADHPTGIERWPTLADLTAYADQQATALAALFDERNGNTYFTDRVAQARTTQKAPAPLPEPRTWQPTAATPSEEINPTGEEMTNLSADEFTLGAITKERIQAALDAKEYSHGTDKDGDIVSAWDRHPFWFMVTGANSDVFFAKARWKAWLPAENHADALKAVNEWNRSKFFPRTNLSVDPDGDIFLETDRIIDLEFGITDAQLSNEIEIMIATSLQFFESLNERFPGAVEAAEAYRARQEQQQQEG